MEIIKKYSEYREVRVSEDEYMTVRFNFEAADKGYVLKSEEIVDDVRPPYYNVYKKSENGKFSHYIRHATSEEMIQGIHIAERAYLYGSVKPDKYECKRSDENFNKEGDR